MFILIEFGKYLVVISSRIFFALFSLFFRDSQDVYVGSLDGVPQVPKAVFANPQSFFLSVPQTL